MLPFLKSNQKSVAGVIMQQRKPDEKPQENQDDIHEMAIHEASQELIDAVAAKDVKAVAQALRNAFEILDSMPHTEGEHTNEG